MSRPLLLDLFCKAGGAGEGYARAGFEVVGVDIEPQPNYPYEFVQGDALEVLKALWLWGDFHGRPVAAIHASPPCQSECAYRRRGAGVGDGYEQLIPQTRELLEAIEFPYVIENVPGARRLMRDPVTYCGSSFGLDVRRHRLFESSVQLAAPPCRHSLQKPGRFPGATNRAPMSRATVEVGVYRIPLETQKAAMGIDRKITLRELSEAIPPAYTEHIGRQLLEHVASLELRRAA